MPKIPQIKCGLFQFDITDYHAILGVPIGASPEQVRRQYLQITRILFPDLRKIDSEEEKQLADQLLSKLVNPAYEILFKNEEARSEHLAVLEQIGERLGQQGKAPLKSKTAQELAKAGEKGEALYQKYLNSIAKQEYQIINKALEKIALISELNLVYLMLKNGQIEGSKPRAAPAPAAAQTASPQAENNHQSQPVPQEKSPANQTASYVEPYLRRGQNFINKQDYSKAILELREALQLEPNNVDAHTLLGLAYVRQKQFGMAKVYINKALQLDPNNKMALEGKQVLDKLLEQSKTGNSSGKKSKGKRGLFGGLFGKKN
ncbi:MAG: molecular chaperone DnaJ [Cyanobacteria bacterium SW_9_44_58]|nr:MAG: molecular chaperone DnaJ [Cyanobacteria bacterium SW_9_44_58]